MREVNDKTYDPIRAEALTLLARNPGRAYSHEVRAMALELTELREKLNKPQDLSFDFYGVTP